MVLLVAVKTLNYYSFHWCWLLLKAWLNIFHAWGRGGTWPPIGYGYAPATMSQGLWVQVQKYVKKILIAWLMSAIFPHGFKICEKGTKNFIFVKFSILIVIFVQIVKMQKSAKLMGAFRACKIPTLFVQFFQKQCLSGAHLHKPEVLKYPCQAWISMLWF